MKLTVVSSARGRRHRRRSQFPGAGAMAQSAGQIGTFPEGVSADSVFVGLTIPLTGLYSRDGGDLSSATNWRSPR